MALALLLCTAGAIAAPAPRTDAISSYEQETLDEAMARLGGEFDPAPEGKTVEAVDIEVLDIIEERDPAPNFLNWLHTNTLEEVVARELLVSEGQPYQQVLVDESQRNLRAIRQHSLVLCRARRGHDARHVRLLVIVKDVWSLRLNSSFRFKGGALEYLFLQPSEENLAGTHRRLAGELTYKPDTVALGAMFLEPRMADTRYRLATDANVIVSRTTGEPEGSYGYVQYWLPLYSTRQEWSWGTIFEWRKEVTRNYSGLDLRTYDATVTPWPDAVPEVYETSTLHGRISVTRSFGRSVKQDVQLGVEGSQSRYDPLRVDSLDPVVRDEFVREILPVSDSRFGPYAQYHLYLNSYTHLLDVETLGLQEDLLTGPELYLRLYPLPRWLGSTRSLMGVHGAAAYGLRIGDGFGRAYLASTLEVDTASGEAAQSRIQTGLRLISPSFVVGRLFYDGTLLFRPHNYLNARETIGGGDRLRGYPSAAFAGQDLLASNLELRTAALQLWTIQLGGVLFYDVGHAFDGFANLQPRQGAGFGLRLVFPQLERAVTRIDWGFALGPRGEGSVFEGLVVTFRQAFAMPTLTSRGELQPLDDQ